MTLKNSDEAILLLGLNDFEIVDAIAIGYL